MNHIIYKIRNIILVVFILIAIITRAQQNPPKILWKSLKTENFEVIFPSEIENDAQRAANTLEWVYNFNTKSLNVKPKPVSVLLYNQSNTSNAFAGIGPRRMGWYLTPPKLVTGLGNVDWVQTLAIHEYRHIVQYAKNRQHFTRFMTFLFGDIGQSMMRWSIPDWFFEGDAVAMETALTKSGRGRIPAFSMNIRAFSLENEDYTYDQAYLKSYKRYYPSHYHLGYPLIAYGRAKYGNDIWDKVLDRTNRKSWWPYAFGTSLKKYTGSSAKRFYNEAIKGYNTTWKKQDSLIQPTEFKVINAKRRRNFTNYLNPQYSSSGNIVCKKTTLDKIGAFYEIRSDGSERKIKNTDGSIFNISNDKIVWSRTIPDVRWGQRSFANIIVFDLKTNKEIQISNKKQYLSPSISPNGEKIVVVEYDNLQNTRILIIETKTGKILKSFDNIGGNNDYCRTPSWSNDGDFIAFTHSKYKGSAMSIINVDTGEIRQVLDYDWDNIGRVVFYKNYLIYNSDYSGIGNINAVDITSRLRYQITSSRFGAYNASISPDKTKMVYQEYTKDGFNIAEIQLNPTKWKKIEDVVVVKPGYSKTLMEQEGATTIDEAGIPNKKYDVKDYKKYKDAIKIHSWGVFSSIPYIDVSISSNNYLNTLAIKGGYLYNTNEKTHGAYMGFSYSKFFPVFSAFSTFLQKKENYNLEDTSFSYNWNEFKLSTELSLPFNLSRNVSNTKLELAFGSEFIKINGVPRRVYIDEISDGHLTPLYLSFSFSNYRNYAWRDFAPRFGQFLDLYYKKIMPYDDYEGHQFSAISSLYFPGLLANNSFKLGATYEKQLNYNPDDNSGYYFFSKKASFARGYESVGLSEFYKLSADYQLPLWSPDLSIGPLAYIKRIRIGGFYDYLEGSFADQRRIYESIGGSLRFEFNVFRVRYPLEVGIQYAHRLIDGDYQISFLLLGLPI